MGPPTSAPPSIASTVGEATHMPGSAGPDADRRPSGIEDLVVVSHDSRMLDVARDMGFTTLVRCAGE
jgi:hypothetical protein